MSNVLSQKESVFQAIVEQLGEVSGNGKVTLTDEQHENVCMIVTQAILAGQTSFSDEARAKHNTEEKVLSYTRGMVDNWLRKDTRLNGGVKAEIKNPGSRTGSSDPEIKALRTLLKRLEADGNSEGMTEVSNAITARVEKLKAEKQAAKAKTIVINADLIPEELKHLIA